MKSRTIILLMCVALCVAWRMLVGAGGFGGIIDSWDIRLAMVLSALLVGGLLGTSGLSMQVLFCNPLADPWILGIASGASFGVAVRAWAMGSTDLYRMPWLNQGMSAVLGASFAMAWLCLLVRRKHATISSSKVLLSGVAIGACLMALAMGLLYAANPVARDQWMQWGFGVLRPLGPMSGIKWHWVFLVFLIWLVSLIWQCMQAKAADILWLGEDSAKALGVPVSRISFGLIVIGTLCAAMAVYLAGPLAFVGLLGPHLARQYFGIVMKRLWWSAPLFAGVLVLIADASSQTLAMYWSKGMMPVGIFTAATGAIAWMVLLRKNTL